MHTQVFFQFYDPINIFSKGRYDKPIGYLLLFWPCIWGVALAMPQINPIQLIHLTSTFFAGSICMRAAGCIINDMWDKEFDKKVERTKTRPLASNQLSMNQAFKFLSLHLAGGLLVLTQLNMLSIQLAFLSVPGFIIYPFLKRISYYPQVVLGLLFNYGAIIGYVATKGVLDPLIVFPVYISGICWTLIYDTIYAHQDKDDDRKIGVKSTALAWDKNTKTICTFLNIISLSLISFSAYQASMGLLFYPCSLISHAYLQYLIKILKIDDPSNCNESFKSNRHFGSLIFFSIIIGQLTREKKPEENKS